MKRGILTELTEKIKENAFSLNAKENVENSILNEIKLYHELGLEKQVKKLTNKLKEIKAQSLGYIKIDKNLLKEYEKKLNSGISNKIKKLEEKIKLLKNNVKKCFIFSLILLTSALFLQFQHYFLAVSSLIFTLGIFVVGVIYSHKEDKLRLEILSLTFNTSLKRIKFTALSESNDLLPNYALERLKTAKETNLFENFGLLKVVEEPDPILVGVINNEYYYIADWGEDITIEDLISYQYKNKKS